MELKEPEIESIVDHAVDEIIGEVFKVTIIPWVFVFASIIVLLMLLPSWLSPFSNTIGYFIAKVMGLTEQPDRSEAIVRSLLEDGLIAQVNGWYQQP